MKKRQEITNKITIVDAIEDQNLFGQLIKDQSTWANWKIFLSALFGLDAAMGKHHLAIYNKYTGREKAPESPFKEAFAIVGRRGGKSFISSIVACYLALFHDWTPYLSRGEIGWIMVIAADRRQGKVILEYIRAILKIKIFMPLVEKELAWEIKLKNQITISIKTCDYRTIRGFTVVAAICDEIAFWRSEGANPAQEILTALRPAMGTIPGSMLLGISTPYNRAGPLYDAFREKFGQEDPDTLIWKAPTIAMNPTIAEGLVDKALKADYSAAKAEWLAEFRDDLEAFLMPEAIEAAVIRNRWELPKVSSTFYQAFVDPSGGRADSFTLAIAHKEVRSEKIVLDRIEERRPPFKPQDVVKEYSKILKNYKIRQITGDRYASEWVVNSFLKRDVSYKTSKLNKSEIYLEFEPLLAQGQLELLDNQKLYDQLRGLERRTRSGGKDLVDHYPGGQDDLANAAAGACVLANKKGCGGPRVRWVN